MSHPPVVVVESGGVPRTQVAEGGSAPAFTVVESGARPITLADNAPPIALFNPDGLPWEAYSEEATALFARFTTPPTSARKTLINNMIVSLKDAGVWSKLDAFYMLAAADEQAARRNWKADQNNLTAVSAPTFTADRGYQGDGSSGNLATGLTPGAGVYALDSAHLGFWSRTNIADAASVAIGARTTASTGQSLILPRSLSDTISYRLNQDISGTSAANTNSTGHIVAVRRAAGAKEIYRNAGSLGSAIEASSSLPAFPFLLLALNNGGVASNHTSRQLAAAHIGASLSAGEITSLYNAVNTYMQAVGAA